MKRMLFSLAAVAVVALSVPAAEPPMLRDAEPPVLRECQCGVACECPACDGVCTVPVVFDPDHICPKCGTRQNVVNQEANGQHSHKCARCSTEWWHADPGVTYTVAAAPPILLGGDCANGQCARPATSRSVATTRYYTESRASSAVRGERRFRLFGRLFSRVRGGCH